MACLRDVRVLLQSVSHLNLGLLCSTYIVCFGVRLLSSHWHVWSEFKWLVKQAHHNMSGIM
jgi:hypothetical protein